MAELIAHEIQVGMASQRDGEKPDHLVQGDPPVDLKALLLQAHLEIDLALHEPESDGLVADQRLVMRFAVGNGLYPGQPVVHDMPHFAELPLLILFFLQVS